MATFTNQATLLYNGNTITSNVVTGEILGRLTANKTALGNDYEVGEPITYLVSLINTGDTVLTGVTLSDDLGQYQFGDQTLVPLDYVDGSAVYYVNGVESGAATAQAGPPLVISGINIPVGGNALVVYQATPNRFASPAADGSVTNTVIADADGVCTEVTASNTLDARGGAVLGINKALEPVPVVENGSVTYTVTVVNSGNTEIIATDDVIISDIFNPALSNISVTYNGTVWTQGVNYTYDEASGSFASGAGQITVPAATVTQDPITGQWNVEPGVSVLRISGVIQCD